ncbi:MAG: hypothetical protein CO093_11165 [Alphaproteobacteria bacterium CG_4_9_14_3_um_filter_47_13]|nr:MAG: hypothetical protein CO093_11165 [Alphaproteobacteria bacterium CG_4_9_14_3_um_filter_47_13]
MKYFIPVFCLALWVINPVFAQETAFERNHSGFGSSLFSGTSHPGFSDPAPDPADVIMIEPAAGNEGQADDKDLQKEDEESVFLEQE